eukprot:3612301-Karenia_brevis.AAC.1
MERAAFCREFIRFDFQTIGDSACQKLRILFHQDLWNAAETGTLNPDLWTVIEQLANVWTLHTKRIEGTNSRLKHDTKLAPFVNWPLLSSRLVSHKRAAQLDQNREARAAFVQTCVDVHDATLQYAKSEWAQQKRFAVVTPDDYIHPEQVEFFGPPPNQCNDDDDENHQLEESNSEVAEPLPQRPRPSLIFREEKAPGLIAPGAMCAAKLIVHMKKELALRDRSLDMSVKQGYQLVYEGNSHSTKSLIESYQDAPGDIWFHVHKFARNKHWMCRAGQTSTNQISLIKPLSFRPLLHVLTQAHNALLSTAEGDGEEDLTVNLVDVKWDHSSLT